MNVQSFYEYVILRDILAFVVPGGISLTGIYMIARSLGSDRWEKTLPFLFDLDPILVGILFILISFLIGHIWDMLYRLWFQQNEKFERHDALKKILVGKKVTDANPRAHQVANEIGKAVGRFLNIDDWEKIDLELWIQSGKAYEASVLLGYWVQEEDPKLFGTEIGRPIVQAHLLHVCGLAFYFLGVCTFLTEAIYWMGNNPQQADPLISGLLIIGSTIFGRALIRQGTHKRDVIQEHLFRVFYVVWRKRELQLEAELKKVEAGLKKGSRNSPLRPLKKESRT